LNARLTAKGRPPAVIREAPGNLEDDDILEMVNAGLMPITIVDDYLASFWKKTFTDLTVNDAATVRTGGTLGVAVRKGSPQLTAALNGFLADYGLGTAFGNMIEKRYLVNTTFAKNAAAEAERAKLRAVISMFQKYGDQYDLDYLLVARRPTRSPGSTTRRRARSALSGSCR
jgi:membrane-bound lytic murein transglycosylase MltF